MDFSSTHGTKVDYILVHKTNLRDRKNSLSSSKDEIKLETQIMTKILARVEAGKKQ